MPTITSWDALHPLIIHFPIALLLVAPIFVLLSLVLRKQSTVFAATALILMTLGTVSVVISVSTGEAAGELAEDRPLIEQALEHHEELAETTEVFFVVLTLIYAAVVAALVFARGRLDGWPRGVLHTAFLLVYAAGCVVLVRTGHEGGRLVHEHGVHASMAPSPSGAGILQAMEERHHEREESDED